MTDQGPEAVVDERQELELLVAQLERMRGMLFGYSSLFFGRIRDWAIVSIALLVLGASGLVPVAIAPLPFIVPFAFLETGYLFYYTVFARRHGVGPGGRPVKHYYVTESVGIACGLLVAALHGAGLATLTHTPAPMGFLNEICGRPEEERPFVLLVVGYPAAGCRVPRIRRKGLDEVAVFL